MNEVTMSEVHVWFSRHGLRFAIAATAQEAEVLAGGHRSESAEPDEWFRQPADARLTIWFAQGVGRRFTSITTADAGTSTRYEKTLAEWVRVLGKGAGNLFCPFIVGDERREGWAKDRRRVDLAREPIEERRNDPISEIDMANPVHFFKAIAVALAASDSTNWGPMKTAEVHRIAGDSEMLECAFIGDEKTGKSIVTAVTGDGPKSKANAEFFASARKVVLGLVSEVDRLQTRNRAMKKLLEEAIEIATEKDERDEPVIGGDHKAAVEFLLEFSERAEAALK